jgi:hypothetical protein
MYACAVDTEPEGTSYQATHVRMRCRHIEAEGAVPNDPCLAPSQWTLSTGDCTASEGRNRDELRTGVDWEGGVKWPNEGQYHIMDNDATRQERFLSAVSSGTGKEQQHVLLRSRHFQYWGGYVLGYS